MGIHEPVRADERPFGIVKVRHIRLLHYDACAFTTWRKKWAIRLDGTISNGINLSRRFFASQALAEDFSRLGHAVVFFGSAFDDARFVAVGSFWIHLEVAQLRARPSRSQSA
jgi:hypothetical protein